MLNYFIWFCVGTALFLDTLSYYRQIKKTLRSKKSSQISSTAFLYKIGKVAFAMTGLALSMNWVGFTMEIFMLLVYIVSLWVIVKYKPRGWSLWK